MLLSVWDLWAHGISTSVYCLVDVAPPLHVYVFQHGCGKRPLRHLHPLLQTASS